MFGIFEEFLGNIIGALLGAGTIYMYQLLLQVLPTKRLWQLKDHTNLVICTATSTKMDESEFHTPATGIGQVRALALIVTSLNRAYKNVKIKNVLLSDDQIHSQIENDLILLGGPKHNRITKHLLNTDNLSIIVDQTENSIIWKANSDQILRFEPLIEDKTIIRDFGLIIRMKNPFSSSRSTVLLFSGGYTYGVIAAARYFTENMYKETIKRKETNKNIVAIVSCSVQDGWPVSINLEKKYIF